MNKTEQWETLKELVTHNKGIIQTKKLELSLSNHYDVRKATYEGAEQALNNIINAMKELENEGMNENGY